MVRVLARRSLLLKTKRNWSLRLSRLTAILIWAIAAVFPVALLWGMVFYGDTQLVKRLWQLVWLILLPGLLAVAFVVLRRSKEGDADAKQSKSPED